MLKSKNQVTLLVYYSYNIVSMTCVNTYSERTEGYVPKYGILILYGVIYGHNFNRYPHSPPIFIL